MPFVVDFKTTYEVLDQGVETVWIRQNAPRMEKRFCTLHIIFRAEDRQPKPTIIFQGTGKRITMTEKLSWDDRVNVMFQPKDWADRTFIQEWCRLHMKTWMEQ